jgi:phosphoglycerate dehydrogenase-like enzyme
MSVDVLCLRPEADFVRAGALPPTEVSVAYRALGDPDVPALMKHARALVIPAVGPKLPLPLFDGTSVKFVQVTGAGVDRLDLPSLKRLGIAVAKVSGGSNTAVAEYAVTIASVLVRRFAWADAEIRAGNYAECRARMVADNLAGLEGLTVGVVGFGVIGGAVACAFRHRGCRILYYDPALHDSKAAQEISAEPVALDELLKKSDVVTLHVPLLSATRGLIGGRELGLMKGGTVLIQASRGGMVDESALAASLQSGHLGGAAIDVYSSEPPAADNPLLSLRGEAARRVLFTPHIAGVTRQAATFLCRAAWRNVERVLIKNEPPLDTVIP